MKNIFPGAVLSPVVKAAARTLDNNGKDFAENLIDVVFEPVEEALDFLDELFS